MKKIKPNENTVDLFWQLLATFEHKCGSNPGALDSALIVAGYKHFSLLYGQEKKPTWAKDFYPDPDTAKPKRVAPVVCKAKPKHRTKTPSARRQQLDLGAVGGFGPGTDPVGMPGHGV